MKNKNNKKTVFVGVSGGVDSSVSAAILKMQGYNVVGAFIRTWTPDFIECTWKDERRDAMRVCAHLDIPFLECDAEEIYKTGVADYMINEYRKGNTPNPDVMCNREVKFGHFWKFANDNGADYIATGHYAINNSELILEKGIDVTKDQSYFLWTLTQNDLSHIIFPIGNMLKKNVRKIALKYKLPTAKKKDSQGVCFLGPLDMKDFLKNYIESKKGNVLDTSGKIIGSHDGAWYFTLGERHGFSIHTNLSDSKPLYIISKNIVDNTIVVSDTIDFISPNSRNTYVCINSNWIYQIPKKNKKYQAQIRYHGEFLNCEVEILDDLKVNIIFEKNIIIDKGQSIVIYDNNICMGGCIVE